MSTVMPASGAGEPRPGRGEEPVPLSEELERIPAGAVLAGVLEDIDIEAVSGYDTVEVMCAEYRLLCRQQARFLRAVLETGLRRPFSISTVERLDRPGEFAAEEARAALVWSRSRAERTFSFAVDVHLRLPLLGQAMLAGELDEPRARAFVDWTAGLADEQAHHVCEQLLPKASECTLGELIERIKRACLAIDPDWAEKKYRHAVRTRRVRGFLGPDGTGTLTGQSQPAERVIAARERIDTLARACKRAGDGRGIDLIRSDLFLGMTDGTFEGLSESEIVAHVLAHPYVLPGEDASPPDDPGEPDSDGSGDGGEGSGDGGGGPRFNRPGGGSGGAGGDHQDRAPRAARTPTSREQRPPAAPTESAEPASRPRSSSHVSSTKSSKMWPVPEVRVQLATLLGRNDEPAEVPGWGFVPAWLARDLVDRMHGAEWRYALCDADGHVIDGGLITTRPDRPRGGRIRRDRRRGGIVEIAFRSSDLPALTSVSKPGSATAAWAPVLGELTEAIATGGGTKADPEEAVRRTAGAALRRMIQQRDRRCVHPCCRVPSTKADQDHRVGYAIGGLTTKSNMSTPCRHDHRLKDEGHWRMIAPRPGLTVWISPLGRRYESRPPPAIPRPILASTSHMSWDLPGSPTGEPVDCRCVLTPCPHNQPDTSKGDPATPESQILDDGEPPF